MDFSSAHATMKAMPVFDSSVLMALIICAAAALATVIGGTAVLVAHRSNARVLAFGLAFAGGAMVYISLIEIFGKSLSAFSEIHAPDAAYIYTTLAFFAGIGLLAVIDRLVPNPHGGIEFNGGQAEGHDHRHVSRLGIMAALAITIHNFPEGMATFFATLDDPVVGVPLAAAIALHNIPEGVSIAIPVYYATGSKGKAVLATFISALAEPLGAIIGYVILAPFLSAAVYGVTFAMIAGVMVFLALDELLPTAKRYATGHETTYGMVSGMAMLALSLVLLR